MEAIDGYSDTDGPSRALGIAYGASQYTFSFASGQAYAGEKHTDVPYGAWSHLGKGSMNMMRPTAPKPEKYVSDEDDLSAEVSGDTVTFKKGDPDNNVFVNGIASPKNTWTYHVAQIVPGGINYRTWAYKSFQFDDEVSKLLDIADNNVITKKTNQVDTTIPLPTTPDEPGLDITKKADRYEYQVGDTIHYTVTVENHNPDANKESKANYLVVNDTDFPEGLVIDEKSYKVSGFNPELKEPDGSARKYEVKNVKGGFEFSTRYLQYGEKLSIEFDAHAEKNLNGTKVPNTARANADGVPEKSESEIVYINSPKMDVQKSVSEERAQKEGETPAYKVGDTINYEVVVKNINKGTFARDMVFTDHITTKAGKTAGVKLDSNSIQVYDLAMHPYTRGSNAEGTTGGTGDYTIDNLADDPNGFTIHFTKPNMGYYENPQIPAVDYTNGEASDKDSEINARYNYEKDYKNLQLMKGYIITYSASVVDESLAGKTITNVAVSQPGKDTNGDKVKDDPAIPSGKGEDEQNVKIKGDTPKLKITKDSDKREYQVGETGHYRVTVTNPENGTTATGVIIKDQFDLTGMKILKDTIKVAKNGKDITGQVGIDVVQTESFADNSSNDKVYNGYIITPSGDNAKLVSGDKYVVTYDVVFTSPYLAGKNIRNVARATSDNCSDEPKAESDPVDVGSDLTAVKTSDPISGTIMKGGKAIKYTVTINNTSKEDKTNVMVRDRIPAHSKFESSDDGKVMQIAGTDYFTARIKNIEAGKSADVSFIVKVDEDTAATEIIHNVAEVHKATSDELIHDNDFPNNIPDELFTTATFNPTNATDHPLRYWVEADNTVTIPGNPPEQKNPGIDLTKKADQSKYTAGDKVNYTLTVKNNGNAAVENLVVSDTLKNPNAKVVSNSVRALKNGADITNFVKSLDVKTGSFEVKTGMNMETTDVYKITYTVSTDNATGNLDNEATAGGDNVKYVKADLSIPPGTPGILLNKEADHEYYKPGEIVTYTLTVKNSSKDTVHKLVIKDSLKTEHAVLDAETIRIVKNGVDITSSVKAIHAEASGFTIDTGMDMSDTDIYSVTYRVKTEGAKGDLDNESQAGGENTAFVKAELHIPKQNETETDNPPKEPKTPGADKPEVPGAIQKDVPKQKIIKVSEKNPKAAAPKTEQTTVRNNVQTGDPLHYEWFILLAVLITAAGTVGWLLLKRRQHM